MDLYIYKRWKICAGDLRIVREQLTATLISIGLCWFNSSKLFYLTVNIFIVSQDAEFLCAVTSLCDKEHSYL
jgi:hypothetical protein